MVQDGKVDEELEELEGGAAVVAAACLARLMRSPGPYRDGDGGVVDALLRVPLKLHLLWVPLRRVERQSLSLHRGHKRNALSAWTHRQRGRAQSTHSNCEQTTTHPQGQG